MSFKKFKEEELLVPQGVSYIKVFRNLLNNFFCYFPAGNSPHKVDSITAKYGVYRKIFRNVEPYYKSKFPKLLGPGLEDPVMVNPSEVQKDLTNALKECGLKIKDVSKIVNEFASYRVDRNDESMEQFYKKAFETLAPVFKAMRNKGYSHHDLWG